MKKFLIFAVINFLLISSFCLANQDSSTDDMVNVYIDCDMCDLDYLRRSVTFVNYVRDRGDADVHIVESFRPTASGGEEFTLTFYGQKNYKVVNDTLKYILQEMDTEETDRNEFVRVVKLGLIQYVNSTPIAKDIKIEYLAPIKPIIIEDPWDSWAFRIGINGNANGQKSSQSSNSWTSLSVERITEEWKFQTSLHASFNDYLDRDYNNYSSSLSRSIWGMLVKSLGEHWSIGGYGLVNSSTYSNTEISYLAGRAVEYSIFPYSESSTHELIIQYKVGASYYNYIDTTIFEKVEEYLSGESITLESQFVQPWGSTFIQMEAQHYFHDFTKNKFSIYANLSLNLFKGFSLDLSGKYSLINDQLSVSEDDPGAQEIFLNQRQLYTNYDYFVNIGLSYSFGSIYNNVVNTRF